MDTSRNPLLAWGYYCQEKSMDELRQSLVLVTLELEAARLKAQEELRIRDDQLAQLRDLLNRAIKERDEAQDKCQRLLFEKLLLQQHQQQQMQQLQQTDPLSGISSIEDEPRRGLDSNNGFSSSDCDESIVSSPVVDHTPLSQLPLPPLAPSEEELELPIVPEKPLPEKGKLLQAVMKAGPLLQTLLLAGPLPQWRHPPPPLDSYQIPPPPVVIPRPPPPPPTAAATHLINLDPLPNITACNNNSINNCGRVDINWGPYECSDSSTQTKYRRVFSH